MIPEECFNINKGTCFMDNEQIQFYLRDKGYFVEIDSPTSPYSMTEQGLSISKIHDIITKVKCPVSWYKSGPFKMECITTYGGKKNKTKKILKNRKSRRRYKNKNKKFGS